MSLELDFDFDFDLSIISEDFPGLVDLPSVRFFNDFSAGLDGEDNPGATAVNVHDKFEYCDGGGLQTIYGEVVRVLKIGCSAILYKMDWHTANPRSGFKGGETWYSDEKVKMMKRLSDTEYTFKRDAGFTLHLGWGNPTQAVDGLSQPSYKDANWNQPGVESFLEAVHNAPLRRDLNVSTASAAISPQSDDPGWSCLQNFYDRLDSVKNSEISAYHFFGLTTRPDGDVDEDLRQF